MADLFWGDLGQEGGTISPTNFFDTSDARAVIRTELSRDLWKITFVHSNFRRYVDKITGFAEKMSDKFMVPKDLFRPEEALWDEVGEFDALPDFNLNFGRFLIQIAERGKQFRHTERADLFSFVDIEGLAREKFSQISVASIERDLLMNAFVYLDVLGITQTGGEVYNDRGKSLAPTKSFMRDVDGIFTPITISQVSYNTTAGTIEGRTPAPLAMSHILRFAQILHDLNVPSYTGEGYGTYLVIINKQAENRLLTDPVFFQAVTYSGDVEKLYKGYIGSFYGQEFVRDEGKYIDKFICGLNPVLRGKAICIFLGKQPVVEAVIRPEAIFEERPMDYGRYKGMAIRTYRGESPTWFSAEGQPVGGILVGA